MKDFQIVIVDGDLQVSASSNDGRADVVLYFTLNDLQPFLAPIVEEKLQQIVDELSDGNA